MENPVAQPDLLTEEILASEVEHASTGQRFFNFLIDNILINYGLGWITGTAIGFIVAKIDSDFAYSVFVRKESWVLFYLFTYIISTVDYVFYYTICETVFNGFTLGKLITRTKAVKTNGEKLGVKDALLRSLARIVPFEAFSAFNGHPWHDKWTDTMVIKAR